MSRYLVTGANGQLGTAAARAFGADGEVVALTRRELDLTDGGAILAAVRNARPDVVVNCAAFNDVDGAEERPLEALRVNALAVGSLAHAAAEVGATLVHYGSDFVFDGTASSPYTEEDRPAPLSVYGASKLLGELLAERAPRHYVLRVESLFGGPARKSSVDRIADALREGRTARVFADRTVTPSYVEDVLVATRGLLSLRAPVGLYNSVNSGTTTWLELAREACRLLGQKERLTPVSVKDVALIAPRPVYCALSNAKLSRAGIPMPSWQDALARYLAVREAAG